MSSILLDVGTGRERPGPASRKARCLWQSGAGTPAVAELASFREVNGTPGRINERDWHKWTNKLFGVELEPYYLRVDGVAEDTLMVPVLAPHETYHAMHEQSEQLFLQSVLGDEPISSVLEFWEQAIMEPWASGHPALEEPCSHHLDRMHAVRFWYDGVESFANHEMHLFCASSLLGHGADPMLHRLVLAAVLEASVPTKRSKELVFSEIVRFFGWSMGHCRRGVMPNTGFYQETFLAGSWRERRAGKSVAGTHFLAFVGIVGDRKARRDLHRHKRWWHCNYMCDKCNACNTSKNTPAALSYRLFGDDAAWWDTLISHEAHVVEVAGRPHSFFMGVEGWHIDLDLEDLVHNVYLGHGRCAVASAIAELLIEQLLPPQDGCMEECMGVLDCELRVWCRISGGIKPPRHRLSTQAIGWRDAKTRGTTNPEVSSFWKAWEVRLLIPFVAQVLYDLGSSGYHSDLRAVCLWGLADWLHVLDASRLVLDWRSRRRAKFAARAYLLCYQKLAADAGRPMWRTLPKHHYFAHLARRTWATGWNPRFETTFALEDYGGRIAVLNRATHGETSELRTIQRHVMGLAVLWENTARALDDAASSWG